MSSFELQNLLHRIARRMTAPVLALAVGSSELGAQVLAIPGGANAAQIIAHAEAEGAAFRRSPGPVAVPAIFASPAEFYEEFLGRDLIPVRNQHTENRTCVTGHGVGPIRSGEFVVGGQLSGRVAMIAGRPGKVWWAPLLNARNMPPLLVRGRSLAAPNDTVRFTTDNVASSGREPQRNYFFASGIMVPQPGRWLMIATSGANWGCFILTVK